MFLGKNFLYSVFDFVFVRKTGSQMPKSNIADAMTNAFAQSGSSQRVSCTKVSKCAIILMYKKHPDFRHKLAARMFHRTVTGEKSERDRRQFSGMLKLDV